MAGTKEDVVLKGCLEYLKATGYFVWRNNVCCAKIGKRYMRFGLAGSSDIIGIMPDGRFLAVECKREKGGVLTERQISFLTKINLNGGVGICVKSVEELITKLKKIEKK